MLKIKKGLINILENSNNNEPEEAPQPPQHVQTQTQVSQPQTPQQPHVPAAQPPAVSRQAEDWGELLIRLLASAPEDVGVQLINCLNKDILIKALEKRNDPYLKVALLLLTKK